MKMDDQTDGSVLISDAQKPLRNSLHKYYITSAALFQDSIYQILSPKGYSCFYTDKGDLSGDAQDLLFVEEVPSLWTERPFTLKPSTKSWNRPPAKVCHNGHMRYETIKRLKDTDFQEMFGYLAKRHSSPVTQSLKSPW